MALAAPRFLSTDNAAPGVYSFAVTPSDTVNFPSIPRAFYVGVTGDVVLVNTDGTTADMDRRARRHDHSVRRDPH